MDSISHSSVLLEQVDWNAADPNTLYEYSKFLDENDPIFTSSPEFCYRLLSKLSSEKYQETAKKLAGICAQKGIFH